MAGSRGEPLFFNYVRDMLNGDGDFWTRSIGSDSGVIRLRVPGRVAEADRQNISFAIADLAHIHGRRLRPVRGAGPATQSHDSWPCSDNASCLVDANCVNVSPVNAAKDAVAKLAWILGPFVNTCTGGDTCNESTNSCDAPACNNDGTCDAGEDACNCSADCDTPNAEVCDDGDCTGDPACVGCTGGQLGDSCIVKPDCCSNKCKGRSGNKTCK